MKIKPSLSCRHMSSLGIVLFLCLVTHPAAAADKTLLVSAAISFREVAAKLVVDYEKRHPPAKIMFNFASSGQLRAQIESGAPVDIFISASADDMDKLSQRRMIIESSRTNLVANRLVLIMNRKHQLAVRNMADLTGDRVRRLAMGNPATVPAGRYAREALEYSRIYEPLRDKLILGENVRQVLDYVVRGEVDCGLVYETDALIDKETVVSLEIPDHAHQPIIYPTAVIRSSRDSIGAAQFIRFLQETDSMKIFRKYGFKPLR